MAISHSNCHLRELVQSCHAVHALRHLDCLEKLKGELVINEDATISASDKNPVYSNDSAVHLSALNIQCFYWVR